MVTIRSQQTEWIASRDLQVQPHCRRCKTPGQTRVNVFTDIARDSEIGGGMHPLLSLARQHICTDILRDWRIPTSESCPHCSSFFWESSLLLLPIWEKRERLKLEILMFKCSSFYCSKSLNAYDVLYILISCKTSCMEKHLYWITLKQICLPKYSIIQRKLDWISRTNLA